MTVGAFQDTVADRPAALAEVTRPVAGAGRDSGVTNPDRDDVRPAPALFTATTSNEYAEPATSPVAVNVRAVAGTVVVVCTVAVDPANRRTR